MYHRLVSLVLLIIFCTSIGKSDSDSAIKKFKDINSFSKNSGTELIASVIPLLVLYDIVKDRTNNESIFNMLRDTQGLKDIGKIIALLACAGCALKLSLYIADGFITKIPYALHSSKKAFVGLVDTMCGCNDPLQIQQLLVYEHMLEQITNGLCEQVPSNAIMMRNLRVAEEMSDNAAQYNWNYYISMLEQTAQFIIMRLQQAQLYYQIDTHASALAGFKNWYIQSYSSHNQTIVFLISIIIQNIEHTVHVCKQAVTSEELDAPHIKKVSRTTLLAFKKLRALLTSSPDQKRPSLPSADEQVIEKQPSIDLFNF